MSKGYSGLFHGTLGSEYNNPNQIDVSYTDRNIEIPAHISKWLESLKKTGDTLIGSKDDFSEKDVSIMSKESGVEFAKVVMGDKTILIRGNKNKTDLSKELINKMVKTGATLEFHTHPHDNDSSPSKSDKDMIALLREKTGQKTSKIVTPNGIITTFSEHGTIEIGHVSNVIDDTARKEYLRLFGGK